MAHAARASGPTTGTSGIQRLFEKLPPGIRPASTAAWAVPLVLGVVYGLWASGIQRDAGPITVGNVFFGILTGVLVAAITYGLHIAGPRMRRETRALAWTVFAGIAIGYVFSLTGASVLWSTVLALCVAAGVFAAAFYHYYSNEGETDISGMRRTAGPTHPTQTGQQ
ncbi:hypothetical protein [Streptomyces jeddahensis]|uniref:Uncharacterized protein n=1 Tax=Streptomyces jeddahensis TaxID=1716141 RepID=A0A177HVZ4_9ACTN|nr:hypothetical protein [Streptomyces jeddahensis]OAH14886.1 hypothetical protein STSP_17230 [Streptomyces jeddahensis]